MKIKAIVATLMIAMLLSACQSNNKPTGDISGKISISGAFALYPLAVKWGDEFKKLHPAVDFDIQGGGAGKGITDVLSDNVNFGMVSRDVYTDEVNKGAFAIAVAKDAVLLTMSADNPYMSDILKRGITKEKLQDIWITGKIKTWGDLLHNGSKENIQIYTRSDACGAAETWAKFFNKKQEDLLGVGVFGDPGLAEAISQNKFAIGFNNVDYIYDNNTKKPNAGIRVLPIDLDGNGQLSASENFYDNADSVNAAIAKGIYPSPPARLLYFVSKGAPSDTLTKSFLRWALTDGQKFVNESGYVKLPDDTLKSELVKLK